MKIYTDQQLPPFVLAKADAWIDRQFGRSKRDNPHWKPGNLWPDWKNTDEHREYTALLVKSKFKSQNPETFGCPLMDVYGQTAIGTNLGMYYAGGRIVAPGGVYLVLPEVDWSREECLNLWLEGLDNESEHRRLMENASLWLAYTGENDRHKLIDPDAPLPLKDALRGPLPPESCGMRLLPEEKIKALSAEGIRRYENGEFADVE